MSCSHTRWTIFLRKVRRPSEKLNEKVSGFISALEHILRKHSSNGTPFQILVMQAQKCSYALFSNFLKNFRAGRLSLGRTGRRSIKIAHIAEEPGRRRVSIDLIASFRKGSKNGQHPMSNRLFIPVFIFLLFCSKPRSVPQEVLAKYSADTDRFCAAMVDCIKEETEKHFQGSPERREMVLRRMSRDLCVKGQQSIIGRLSVDPLSKTVVPFNPALYQAYSSCAAAVSEAKTCPDRLRVHRENPDCLKIRNIYQESE